MRQALGMVDGLVHHLKHIELMEEHQGNPVHELLGLVQGKPDSELQKYLANPRYRQNFAAELQRRTDLAQELPSTTPRVRLFAVSDNTEGTVLVAIDVSDKNVIDVELDKTTTHLYGTEAFDLLLGQGFFKQSHPRFRVRDLIRRVTYRVHSKESLAQEAQRMGRAQENAALWMGVPGIQVLKLEKFDSSLPGAWWQDPEQLNVIPTVSVSALRRKKNDPGIGKWTDVPRFFESELKRYGMNAFHLLPFFATLPENESPYAPVSMSAWNTRYLDWCVVDDVRPRSSEFRSLLTPAAPQSQIDFADVHAREEQISWKALGVFEETHLARNSPRAQDFKRFIEQRTDIFDYAQFMARHELLSKSSLAWTAGDLEALERDRADELNRRILRHQYMQWLTQQQATAALEAVVDAGGHPVIDIPLYRNKDSVEVYNAPQFFVDVRDPKKHPGILREMHPQRWETLPEGQRVYETWEELALWNWSALRETQFEKFLSAYQYWLDFQVSGKRLIHGIRVDGSHLLFSDIHGQLDRGGPPGELLIALLSRVVRERDAFPMAEAFDGKSPVVGKYGFISTEGAHRLSMHDDAARFFPTEADFTKAFDTALAAKAAGTPILLTIGDWWGDTDVIKAQDPNVPSRRFWRYRIPMAGDGNFAQRRRFNAGPYIATKVKEARGSAKSQKTVVWAAMGGLTWAALILAAGLLTHQPTALQALGLFTLSTLLFGEELLWLRSIGHTQVAGRRADGSLWTVSGLSAWREARVRLHEALVHPWMPGWVGDFILAPFVDPLACLGAWMGFTAADDGQIRHPGVRRMAMAA